MCQVGGGVVEPLVFGLVGTVGALSEALHSQREVAANMARVYLALRALAKCCKVDLTTVVRDKFAKNNRKYPAARAFGSRAKYTVYESDGGNAFFLTGAKGAAAFAAVVLGIFVARRVL
eukprot:TRINITY_DN8854_c0_g1_i3.p4 TRINITY_DN8854_c0_g1~~TRINITY_DN8854_c0_g1_i3.p4  ORF type:complete len:119 (-),score=29.51 TRINITY_DN8854_c0_g1_i3:28-384(-)